MESRDDKRCNKPNILRQQPSLQLAQAVGQMSMSRDVGGPIHENNINEGYTGSVGRKYAGRSCECQKLAG